jgi:hypothetical protein
MDPSLKARPSVAFNHPILVVDVDLNGLTKGVVYFLKMSAFSKLGGMETFLLREQNRFVRRDNSQYIFPIAWDCDSDQAQGQNKTFLHLENESDRKPNLRMKKDACVVARRLHSVDPNDLRCYSLVTEGFWSIGALRDGVRIIEFLKFFFIPFFEKQSLHLMHFVTSRPNVINFFRLKFS